jgi:pimeloyl-ACP methyl ester carboxylesterase
MVEERKDVTVDGKQLETLLITPAGSDHATVVLLHEGLGSIALWKDFPIHLAERTGYRVFVYSRYGHGRSARLTTKRDVNYMHHEGEVVLPALLEQMGIQRPVLLGHSDGASIAIICGGRYPNVARALILEAPDVFVEDLSVESIARAKTMFETTDLPQRLSRYHDHADDTFWGWNDMWLDARFRSWNIETYLDTIQCPILLIQGYEDEYGTTRQVEAITDRVATTQTLLLPQCGHSPHRDQPEAVLARIAAFLADLA